MASKHEVLLVGESSAMVTAMSTLLKGKTSAKARAEAWLDMNGIEKTRPMIRSVEVLLLIQDRDTRHACAESTLGATDPHAAAMRTNGFV